MIPALMPSIGQDSTPDADSLPLPPPVLVVDSSDTCRALLIFLLRLSGYRAIGAHDALRAMALLPGLHPILIIGELELLCRDTGSLLAYCRAEQPDVPILMLAAALPDSPPDVEAGMAGFLLKPIDPGKFCAAVNRVITRAARVRGHSAPRP